MCGVEISDLPCLVSGKNPNLTSDYIADLQHPGIAVNDDNEPAPENTPIPENIPLPQMVEENSWRY